MTFTLTDDERAVLWAMHPQDLHELAGAPAYAIEGMRLGERSGGTITVGYRCTKTAYERKWFGKPMIVWWPDRECHDRCRAYPNDRWPPGTYCLPHLGKHFKQYERGPLLRESRITYKRLQRWIESLTTETRTAIRDTAWSQDLHWLRVDLLGPKPGLPALTDGPEPTTVDDQYTLF